MPVITLSLTHPLCFVPNVALWLVARNYLARSGKVQWRALFKFTWSVAGKFKNANWTLLTASVHYSWHYHISFELYRRLSRFRGVCVGKRDIHVQRASRTFLAFLLNQNVGRASINLCPEGLSGVCHPSLSSFPEHFFFFPRKCILCM